MGSNSTSLSISFPSSEYPSPQSTTLPSHYSIFSYQANHALALILPSQSDVPISLSISRNESTYSSSHEILICPISSPAGIMLTHQDFRYERILKREESRTKRQLGSIKSSSHQPRVHRSSGSAESQGGRIS